ncbi:hypothetical protein [Paenibacillus polymyxa]|uniref:Uncharacterized protein n=1 Tax=Paenibacillus polymyxa (strain SC2) TaxID=886882 RepID=E3EL07_PAEPS|nr:hypothetical protein [Paenibacillus polymyxa]ADO59569.1 hypothetical protein PPSC2_27250 [Paenibacillus polymyxa SC2]WPQ59601.1 hypothetical protein SKN87_28465 [Paenibacillus polymyxa]
MSNQLILVTEPDTGLEWLYVNGIQVTSGEPIYAEQWMSALKKYMVFDRVSSVELTEAFDQRVDYDYGHVPTHYDRFQEGDLKEKTID